MNNKTNEFYNATLKCTKSSTKRFTVDKEYPVVNGILTDNAKIQWHNGHVSSNAPSNLPNEPFFRSLKEIHARINEKSLVRASFEEIPNYPISTIVITVQGEVTTCTMIENGRIKKQTQAICSPKDKPDFETGARIAFDRCCKSLAENSSFAKKEAFRPHLAFCNGDNCGFIGEPTNQTSFGGEPLFVGDCVSLYDTQREKNIGIRIVAKTDFHANGYIMGVADCEFINGVCKEWQIKKVVSFKDLKRNGFVDNIKVVLTNEN